MLRPVLPSAPPFSQCGNAANSTVDLCVLAERHERLLAAICGGDPDAAEAAARTHQHEAAQLIAAMPDGTVRAAETHEDPAT